MSASRAAIVRESAESQSTIFPQLPLETIPRPAKRKSLPQKYDELSSARPRKRMAGTDLQDPPTVNNLSLARSEAQLSGTKPYAVPATKRPAHRTKIISRAYEWEDGTSGKPVSDDENDSSIDWDEPDMIPSDAPTDQSLSSWLRASWHSWRRHKQRIEAKIDRSRQYHGVFGFEELRDHEQSAMRDLQRRLDMWSQSCIVCDFTGNPQHQHSTGNCPDPLNRAVQIWASLFLARLQPLAYADTQSCPTCLIPKLICDRWKQERQGDWVNTGVKCQYDGVVVLTIVTALEGAAAVRADLDAWMDLSVHSRNLDMLQSTVRSRAILSTMINSFAKRRDSSTLRFLLAQCLQVPPYTAT